jgi:AcrR family transcriptional regulator
LLIYQAVSDVDAPPRRGRPPKRTARDTRSGILDAALGLFARQGYAGTSVRQIAAVVGLSDAGLYAHFPSKRAIAESLVAEWGPDAVAGVLTTIEPELVEQPANCVRQFSREVMEAWDEPRARRFMDAFMREGGFGSELGRTRVAVARDDALRQLATLFRRWLAEGRIVSAFPPDELAWHLFAGIAFLRILFLHGSATDAERAEGHRRAAEHVEFFLASAIRESESTGERTLWRSTTAQEVGAP